MCWAWASRVATCGFWSRMSLAADRLPGSQEGTGIRSCRQHQGWHSGQGLHPCGLMRVRSTCLQTDVKWEWFPQVEGSAVEKRTQNQKQNKTEKIDTTRTWTKPNYISKNQGELFIRFETSRMHLKMKCISSIIWLRRGGIGWLLNRICLWSISNGFYLQENIFFQTLSPWSISSLVDTHFHSVLCTGRITRNREVHAFDTWPV